MVRAGVPGVEGQEGRKGPSHPLDRIHFKSLITVFPGSIISFHLKTLGKTRDDLAKGSHQPRSQISVHGAMEHITREKWECQHR